MTANIFRMSAVAGMLVLYSGIVSAQHTCGISAKISVLEKHNFNPVYPAIVHITPGDINGETDEQGNLVIDTLCPGHYTIHAVALGYEPITQEADITGNTSIRLTTVYSDHELRQVEIQRDRVQTVLQSKESLSKEQLAEGAGKNLSELLQGINGVSMYSNGATISKPVIHGLHSNRIVMLNNGIRQEDQQWGDEHAPNIDPFLANKVTVIKGAAGVRYGTDAIAGVVLVEPQPLRNKPGWDGELNLAGFSNNRMGVGSMMIEHNFKDIPSLSFRLQGTYKKGGNYRIPGYWVANTGVEESNYSATLGYRKAHYGAELFYSHFNTNLGIYTGSHTGNKTDLMNAINSPVPLVQSDFTYDIQRPKQHVSHDLLKAKLYAESKVGLWSLIYGYQHNFRQEYDIMRIENGKAQLNLTLNTHTLNINLDHKPIKNISGQVGFDGELQDNFFQNGDRLFIPTYRTLGGAAYLIERYKFKNFELEGGLRYDYRWYEVYNPEGNDQHIVYYQFGYNNLSGTLGIRQQLQPNWEWSATFANAWRAPQASELFSAGLHHGAARIEIGNKNLSPERSYSLNLGTTYTWNNKLTVDIGLYSQLINDYIFLEPGPDLLTIRGYFKTFQYMQTNAWLNGADVLLKYQWNDYLQSSLKGSTVLGRDRSKKDWIILMPSDRIALNTRYTRNISPALKDCFLSIDAKYVFRQTRIPSNFDSIDYPRPPAGYLLLDASVGTQLMLSKKQPLFISVAVTNILNQKYRDYMDVFRYFIDQPGTNVALRLRLPFEFK